MAVAAAGSCVMSALRARARECSRARSVPRANLGRADGSGRRITAELLCSENGLEKLAKISRDKNSFKRTRNVVRGACPIARAHIAAVPCHAWPCGAPISAALTAASYPQAVEVRHLVGLYESWARQLLPTVPFPDFVQQLEKISSNGKIQIKQMQIEQGHEDWAMDADVDAVSSQTPGWKRASAHLPPVTATVHARAGSGSGFVVSGAGRLGRRQWWCACARGRVRARSPARGAALAC